MSHALTQTEARWNEKTIGALAVSLAASNLLWAVAAAWAAGPLKRSLGC